MEESICISSDSDPSPSPVVIEDLDDDLEFPKARLSDICGVSTDVKAGENITYKKPNSGDFEWFGKSVCEEAPKGQNGSNNDVMLFGQSGPSSSTQVRANGSFPKTNSFHELSDSDTEDTTKLDSPKFEGMPEVGKLPRHSPVWDVDFEIPSKRNAPLHELSDSDSDQTIPAVGSPKNADLLVDENTRSFPVSGGSSGETQPPESGHVFDCDFGSISDEESPMMRLSNSSFKLDKSLSQNVEFYETLAPNKSPFKNLSGESTQPFSSTICLPTAGNGPDLFQSNSEPLFSTSYCASEFVTQLGANSQPLDLNNGSKPSRKRTKNSPEDVLERKRLKEMKEKEKAEKAAVAESLRRLRPGECLKVGVSTPVDESHIVFLWSVEKLLTSIQFGTFIDTFAEFKNKYPTHKLLLAVYGLHDYYRKQHKAEQRKKRVDESRNTSDPPSRKRKSAYEVTETQIEMELIALQVRLGISHKALNSPQDAAGFLQVITKSVAELPFKLERERIDEERNWYAKGDSRNCVRIDKDFNGLGQLWLQQLAQYNNSSLDTAKAIAQLYPTPLSIYNAYKEQTTTKEKEQMLQEIVVKRGSGGGGRRLGPELSKKISLMFCQDEEIPLG